MSKLAKEDIQEHGIDLFLVEDQPTILQQGEMLNRFIWTFGDEAIRYRGRDQVVGYYRVLMGQKGRG